MKRSDHHYPDVEAIGKVLAALDGLEKSVQQDILTYVEKRLGLRADGRRDAVELPPVENSQFDEGAEVEEGAETTESTEANALEGGPQLSAAGRKWMQRSGISAQKLSRVISVDGDEVDLVAESVPGDSVRLKMRSVIMLKAIAAYLAGGSANVKYDAAREACTHYGAWDGDNGAAYLKKMQAEISGGRATGFKLTPRGFASATKMIQDMIGDSGGEKAGAKS